MQIHIYRLIFFSSFLFLFFSCEKIPDNINIDKYETSNVISEDILATLHKTVDKIFFDFEIENVKYTLLEIKQEGGNSLYVFHATKAETWQEHENLRSKAMFNLTFEFQQDYLFTEFFSYGLGYATNYNLLDETVLCEIGLER